ncbi:hypothetical protein [Streptomyces tauricus]|uniref:hypothetical protein n=1 Tax=Streptomyces tauricus TaxID=68274 RepID=UPI003439208E
MMPASETIAPLAAVGQLRSQVTMHGDYDPNQPDRVEIPVSVHLSFWDILGVLSYTSGVCVAYDEMDDDDYLRRSVQFGLIGAGASTIKIQGLLAWRTYYGKTPSSDGTSPEFLRRLGTAVTRTFGVTPKGGAV